MTDAPLLVRLAVSEKLRAVRQEIAEAVTEEFFKRHPDWLVRYGERGKKLGIEDACYHLDFLAGAVETGSAAPFADYVHWVVNMLGARGIAASFLAENLTQIEGALRERLNTTEQAVALPVLEAGLSASGKPPLSRADTERQSGVKTALSVFLQAILLGEGQAALNIAFETMK